MSLLPRGAVTSDERIVLMVLACDSFDGADTAPGWEALARWTGMYASSVRTIVGRLERPNGKRPALLKREDNRGRRRARIVLLDPTAPAPMCVPASDRPDDDGPDSEANVPVTPAGPKSDGRSNWAANVPVSQAGSADQPADEPADKPADQPADQPAGPTGTSLALALGPRATPNPPADRDVTAEPDGNGWNDWKGPETVEAVLDRLSLAAWEADRLRPVMMALVEEGLPVGALNDVCTASLAGARSKAAVIKSRLAKVEGMSGPQVWSWLCGNVYRGHPPGPDYAFGGSGVVWEAGGVS